MIGRTIRHYTIEEKIGQGGMGEVYRATDSKLRKSVALKFFPEATAQDESARRRLLREARAAARLDHPYICHVYEVGEVDGIDFIVMEYVSGKTLKDRMEEGRLPVEESLRIAAEIAEALDNAQEKGIIHRDLKPANIMLTRDDHVKLMDFGLAKAMPDAQESQLDSLNGADLTRAGVTVGTPAYMSPEQLRHGTVDSRSDIFAFGIILYEMLAGIHPFLRRDLMATIAAIMNEEPQPVELHQEGLHPVILHMVRKVLAKDPRKRYQSARDILNDLVAVMQHSGPVVPVPDPPVPLPNRSWSVPFWMGVPILLLGMAGVWALRPDPSDGTTALEEFRSRVLVPDGRRIVHLWWSGSTVALAPDGKTLAFLAGTAGSGPGRGANQNQIFVQRFDEMVRPADPRD